MKFKVWIEIEPVDDDGDEIKETAGDLGILPDSLGTFDTFREAIEVQAQVAKSHGIDPENSDACKAVEGLSFPPEPNEMGKFQDDRRNAADDAFASAKLGVTVNDSDGWETDGPDRLIRRFYYEDEEHPDGDSLKASFIVDFKPGTVEIVDSHANF